MAGRERVICESAELAEGGAVKHDIAVPVSRLPETIRAIEAKVAEAFPECRLNIFGHLGDGNLHLGVAPRPWSEEARHKAEELVYQPLADVGGSISAEHGIGLLKRDALAQHEPAVAIDLMRRVKAALDPQGRLNPGKLLPPTQE
jgi:FAD/FMN-containing dehydrogenase